MKIFDNKVNDYSFIALVVNKKSKKESQGSTIKPSGQEK